MCLDDAVLSDLVEATATLAAFCRAERDFKLLTISSGRGLGSTLGFSGFSGFFSCRKKWEIYIAEVPRCLKLWWIYDGRNEEFTPVRSALTVWWICQIFYPGWICGCKKRPEKREDGKLVCVCVCVYCSRALQWESIKYVHFNHFIRCLVSGFRHYFAWFAPLNY